MNYKKLRGGVAYAFRNYPPNWKSSCRLMLPLILLSLLWQADLHAGGSVKARSRGEVYKAKGKVRCPGNGTQRDRDRERHPNVAEVFVRNPSNSFMTLGASVHVWIGRGGWGITPDVFNSDCTTGGQGSDFVDLFHAYQPKYYKAEEGELKGGGIRFDPVAKSVTIPDISGVIKLDQYTRSFTFHLTIWETPDDDDNWEMPDRNILWQGSALMSNGHLRLIGFDSSQISLQGLGEIHFHDFSKTFTFPEADFDLIEVDIRYETEGNAEGMLERMAEETSSPKEVEFTLFPNPASSYAVMSFRYLDETSSQELFLQLFDHKGQLVEDLGTLACPTGCAEIRKKITIEHLPQGTYYLSASGSSRLYVRRLIVN